VQPQNNTTGYRGSNNGEPQALAGVQLPSVEASQPEVNEAGVAPAAAATPQSGEHWVEEIERIFQQTVQNPKQRADMLIELRARYQQDILGLTVGRDA